MIWRPVQDFGSEERTSINASHMISGAPTDATSSASLLSCGDVRIAGPTLGIQPMLAACVSWGRGGHPPDLNTVDGDAGSCPVVCRWG